MLNEQEYKNLVRRYAAKQLNQLEIDSPDSEYFELKNWSSDNLDSIILIEDLGLYGNLLESKDSKEFRLVLAFSPSIVKFESFYRRDDIYDIANAAFAQDILNEIYKQLPKVQHLNTKNELLDRAH